MDTQQVVENALTNALRVSSNKNRSKKIVHDISLLVGKQTFLIRFRHGRMSTGSQGGNGKAPTVTIDRRSFDDLIERRKTLTDLWFEQKLKLQGLQKYRDDLFWFLPILAAARNRDRNTEH